jgi:hypothetical protein
MNSLVHRSPRKRAEHNDIYALSKGGIGQSRIRVFITRREKIKSCQKMNARYWSKKVQKFVQYWAFGKGSKSRKKNAN